MYTIYVIFRCLPGKREGFIQKMKDTGILAAIRAEDGCHCYNYYLSDEDPDQILLVEQWESKAHQQAHIQTPHMALVKQLNAAYVASVKLGEYKVVE